MAVVMMLLLQPHLLLAAKDRRNMSLFKEDYENKNGKPARKKYLRVE